VGIISDPENFKKVKQEAPIKEPFLLALRCRKSEVQDRFELSVQVLQTRALPTWLPNRKTAVYTTDDTTNGRTYLWAFDIISAPNTSVVTGHQTSALFAALNLCGAPMLFYR
jgi:hypothetical protein